MRLAERRGRNAIFIAGGLAVLAGAGVALISLFVRINIGASLAVERAEREELMTWLARILFGLGAIWILIGVLAARTRLVRRPGAAAARATWLSFSRPWRARESMLGLLAFDRWLMVIVPAGMLVSTHLVVASFLSAIPVLLSSAGWFIFGLLAIVLIWPRSAWPTIAALSGTAIVWCLVMLAGVMFGGPGHFWLFLWETPWMRSVVMTVVLAVLAWAIIAAGGAINAQLGSTTATGIVLAAAGGTAAALAIAVAILGPEWLGAQWFDQTVELTIEPWVIWFIAALGAATFAVGVVVTVLSKRRQLSH